MGVQLRAQLSDLRKVDRRVRLEDLLAYQSVAIVGAGGKSTLLSQLYDLSIRLGRHVLATTSTKMYASQLNNVYVGQDLLALGEHCQSAWSQGQGASWADHLIFTGESSPKAVGPSLSLVHDLLGNGEERLSEQDGILACRPDFFLYEADGAKGRVLKSPKSHEPVVGPWTDATVLVLRLDCLGKKLTEDLAYNAEALADIMDLRLGDEIGVDSLRRLILHKEGAFARTTGHPYLYFLYEEGQEGVVDVLLKSLQEALQKGEDLAFRGGGQGHDSPIDGEAIEDSSLPVGALLLAAGQSQRLGRDKRKIYFQGQSLFFRACRSLAHCEPKFAVVSGDRSLAKVAEAEGFQVIWQEYPERGQGDSLSLGVKAFRQYFREESRQVKGLLCLVGDQPLFNSDDVACLQEAFTSAYNRHGDKAIAMSAFGEEQRRGNPVIFGAHWWAQLETIVGDQGGRILCKEEGRQYVGCGTFTKEKGFDVDSVDDYGKLRQIEVTMKPLVLVRGGGDIASGCIYRLWRAGYPVLVNEIAIPTMVRREVCYGNAVHRGEMIVERLVSRYVSMDDVEKTLAEGVIPVLTDDYESIRQRFEPQIVVDAIIAKKNKGTKRDDGPLVIALGPGFTAGKDVDVVVETMRGHSLGRCIYDGEAIPNTGVPGEIDGHTYDRVLYAPCEGLFQAKRHIGEIVAKGEIVAYVEDQPVKAQVAGVLRGLLKHGLMVPKGMKIGDVDSRCEEAHCFSISDKALAIAGGVMEAVEAWRVERGKHGRDV